MTTSAEVAARANDSIISTQPLPADGSKPSTPLNPTLNTVTNPPTSDTNTQLQSLPQYMANQMVNPTVPNDAQLTPVLEQTDTASLQNKGELLNNTDQNTIQPAAATQVNPQQISGQTVDPNAAAGLVNPNGNSYDATQVGAAQSAGVAPMQVKPLDTVQGQLASLYSQMQDGTIPAWAQGAVNTVNDVLGSRGLKPNSSIGATALFGAVQQQATNIAAADAATYFQTDMANFSAAQQTDLANLQNRQQSLLSNQSAENAAKQFNASSITQVQEFMASMVSQIQSQNADRVQASDVANQNVDEAAQQFNSSQEFNRQQFNAETQFAIDQSNVLWRRELNTANTAAVNAANQFNVQNKFNLSTTAMNNLWQQLRDESSWAFTASENQKNRDYNVAIASNNLKYLDNATSTKWYEDIGGLVANLFFT